MTFLAFYSSYGLRKEKTNAKNGYFLDGRSFISWSIIRFMANSSISKYAVCVYIFLDSTFL